MVESPWVHVSATTTTDCGAQPNGRLLLALIGAVLMHFRAGHRPVYFSANPVTN